MISDIEECKKTCSCPQCLTLLDTVHSREEYFDHLEECPLCNHLHERDISCYHSHSALITCPQCKSDEIELHETLTIITNLKSKKKDIKDPVVSHKICTNCRYRFTWLFPKPEYFMLGG